MAIKFYRYNDYLKCDVYKLDGSNAKFTISKLNGNILSIRLHTFPVNAYAFCQNLALSFDKIVKDFECDSIIITLEPSKNFSVTREDAKTPEKVFYAFKRCLHSTFLG